MPYRQTDSAVDGQNCKILRTNYPSMLGRKQRQSPCSSKITTVIHCWGILFGCNHSSALPLQITQLTDIITPNIYRVQSTIGLCPCKAHHYTTSSRVLHLQRRRDGRSRRPQQLLQSINTSNGKRLTCISQKLQHNSNKPEGDKRQTLRYNYILYIF